MPIVPALLALALVACEGTADGSVGEPGGAESEAVVEREVMRRDLLGSALSEGPAWVPGTPLYTEAQAERGEDLFLLYCSACHGLDEMTSAKLHDNWTGRSVGDFYEYVRYAMPYDVPGRLSGEENADLVAFIFRENGLPAGSEPLPPSGDALQGLRLSHPDSLDGQGGRGGLDDRGPGG